METTASKPILEVVDLRKSFGGLLAVNDVNLTVHTGEILGVLGPNGAGKTTLFNLIAGFLKPTWGRILFKNRDLTGCRPDRRCRLGLARTFQIALPFPELTVEENVMVGTLAEHGRIDAMREAAQEHIDLVGLGPKRHALAKHLSTGQRKRLELARAMATKPSLLLLDEATGGVDQPSIQGLVDLVLSLRDCGVTLVAIEHNMSVITRMADRLIFLDRGKVLAEGEPGEVMQHPAVVELYLGAGRA